MPSTVIIPAETADLVSLAAVKMDLGITGSEYDAALADRIARASAVVVAYIGRTLAVETVQDEFLRSPYEPARSRLVLSRWPVSAVVSVTEDGVTLSADAYRVDLSTGLLLRISGAWCAASTVVRYTAGFDPMPLDVQDLTLQLIRVGWFARDRDPTVRTETVDGVGALTWMASGGMAITDAMAGVLDRYRGALV